MKALLVASGDAPGFALLMKEKKDADLTIAIDGGIAVFEQFGLSPDIIVGDGDSGMQELTEKYKIMDIPFIFANKEKNETDAFLALEEAIKAGSNEVALLGATGGRMDHFLSNMMLLKWAHQKNVRLTIEDDRQWISIGQGDFEISGQKGQTISILPVDEFAIVTAEGLYYPLQRLRLANNRPRGISNLFLGERASIHTKEPVIIIKIKQ